MQWNLVTLRAPMSLGLEFPWLWAGLILVCLNLLAGCSPASATIDLQEPETVQAQLSALTVKPVPTSSPTVAISSVPAQTETSTTSVTAEESGSETEKTDNDPQQDGTDYGQPSWANEKVKRYKGEYYFLDDHHDGHFTLTHTGPTITAVFSTTRSPVHHYAVTGERLFWIPREFQPTKIIIWEVQGWPVTMDGRNIPEPSGPYTFRMQVSSDRMQVGADGTVLYLDDRGVDGLGYVRYTVKLAWPAPGVTPQVCARDPDVKQAILESLNASHCDDVTWGQLASIRYLGSWFSISKGTDLAGLTRLESMSLKLTDGIDLESALAQVPRLKDLGLSFIQEELSDEFLKSSPLLTNLELQSSNSSMPVGFLTSTEQLNHLSISLEELTVLPDSFLASTPQLTSLNLSLPKLKRLPAGFLANTPQLTRLNLSLPELTELPAGFLANAPALESLRLHAPQLTTIAPEVWAQLEDHSPTVVVMGSAQQLYYKASTQSATKDWARPGRWLEIMSRKETPEGNWVQVRGHWHDFGSGDYSVGYYWRMWLKDPHLVPAGFPLVTFDPVVEESFLHQDRNLGSRYRLQRTGATVIARLEVESSPVHFFARTQSSTLFVIPPEFRPAEEIVWEVVGWPVDNEGPVATQFSSPSRFRLRITPEGDVSYVDDSGVDGVGHLKYAVSLAWPLADAEPEVCSRNKEVQKAVLDALQLKDCAEVTWEHLASIRRLHGFLPVSQSLDLAGLSNLESVELWAGNGPGLSTILGQMPRLQHLKLIIDYSKTLSPDLLHSLPQLKSLELYPSGGLTLPADFLVNTPLLEALHLGGAGYDSWGTNFLPETFLSPVPLLKRFHWASTSDKTVPANLLKHVPELQQLELAAYSLTKLPKSELRHVPHLTELDIWTRNALGVPADFLVPLPRLTRFRLINGSPIPISFDLLVPTPRLRSLELWLGQIKSPPTHFLTAVPQLTDLEFFIGWHWPGGSGLDLESGPGPLINPAHEPFPTDFLANSSQLAVAWLSSRENHFKSTRDYENSAGQIQPFAPRVLRISVQRPARLNVPISKNQNDLPLVLKDEQRSDLPESLSQQASSLSHIAVRTNDVSNWPDDLLSTIPNLTHLTLQSDNLAPLPGNWMSSVLDLNHLILEMDDRGNLPTDFLTLPSSVSYLTVQADEVVSLSTDWLPQSPQVSHLVIQADYLKVLPHNLLEPFPNLTHLFLFTDQLTEIGSDLLGAVPDLTHLTLQTSHLEELPFDLLVHSPNLTYLALHTQGLSSVPADLLRPTRDLTRLVLVGDNLRKLPENLLNDLQQLHHFYLQADNLTSLPEGFLNDATELTFLTLQVDCLQALPASFLERTRSLTHLYLRAEQLMEMPDDFEANWSDLDYLNLVTKNTFLYSAYRSKSVNCF